MCSSVCVVELDYEHSTVNLMIADFNLAGVNISCLFCMFHRVLLLFSAGVLKLSSRICTFFLKLERSVS